MAIYVDVLLAINFAIDFLILKAAAAVCGHYVKAKRLCFGAATGALSSFLIFCSLSWAAEFLINMLLAALICAAAFYPCKRQIFLKLFLAQIIISFVFSGLILFWQITVKPVGVITKGLAVYFDIGAAALLICSVMGYAAACLISKLMSVAVNERQLCEVKIENNGASAAFFALIDTGSSLCEPFSNSPVIVCELSALGKTVPDEVKSFSQDGQLQGIRLVPYKTLDSSGLLPAFLPRRIMIKTQSGEEFFCSGCYIAVITGVFGGDYRAVCNPKVLLQQINSGER